MKKLFTFIFLLTILLSARAESVTWTAAKITGYNNNDNLDGYTQSIDDNLSITLSTADGGTTFIKYRKLSYLKSPYVMVYPGNTITITATNATITSVSFNILTESDEEQAVKSDITPGWELLVVDQTLNSTNGSTWTGEAETVTIKGSSKTALIGITIEYTITDDEGGETPDTPEEYKTAILRFSEDQVTPNNESSPKVEISDNNVTAVFISNSTSAKVQANNGYFGTADDFVTIPYRYSSGTRSSNGTSSNTMCTVTVPCTGKLVIYGYNNSDKETERKLNVMQNDKVILDYTFDYNGYVQPEGQNKKVYPIIDVSVEEGTVYLLYITNGLCFFGFDFVPADNSYKPEDGCYLVGSMTKDYDGGNVPNPSYQFTSTGNNTYSLTVGEMSENDTFEVAVVDGGDITYYGLTTGTTSTLQNEYKGQLSKDENFSGYMMKLANTMLNVTFTFNSSTHDFTVNGTLEGEEIVITLGNDKTMQSGEILDATVEGMEGLISMQTENENGVSIRVYAPDKVNTIYYYVEKSENSSENVEEQDDDYSIKSAAPKMKVTVPDGASFKAATVNEEEGYAHVSLPMGEGVVYLSTDENGDNAIAYQFEVTKGTPTGVDDIFDADVNAPIYNIFGQQVDDSYRGIVIKNGKKFIKNNR